VWIIRPGGALELLAKYQGLLDGEGGAKPYDGPTFTFTDGTKGVNVH
jgi:hypothetical protein